MASHRIGDAAGPSNHHHHQVPYATLHQGFLNQEGSAFDFGELEEAIVLQGVKFRHDEAKTSLFTAAAAGRPAATLEMFPSWPIRFQQTPRGSISKSGGERTDSGSALNTISSTKAEASQLEQPESPISNNNNKEASSPDHHQQQLVAEMTNDASRTGPSSSQQNQSVATAKPPQEKRKGPGSASAKQLDAKTLRRLAQNREAARKSRLRKKAYVQQLESSRIKFNQLEQELQRARSQGLLLGGCGGAAGNISSGAAIFDMEYARWLEDDHRHMSELRTSLNAHLSDGDLKIIVDGYISHYDEIFRLKGVVAKSDVFHLITGMWTTSAERCFFWIGGFRPSELIKMLISQLDPLTEQQVMGIYSLQHSSQQAEEALSQGLEQLQQSLVETIAVDPVIDGMQQMVVALGKLANLEGFVRQADNLRQQTIHQLRRILTVRQSARCFLMIGDYYWQLRALSSLWTSRPQEAMISEDNSCKTTTALHVNQNLQNRFSNF